MREKYYKILYIKCQIYVVEKISLCYNLNIDKVKEGNMRKIIVTDKYNGKKLNNFILDTFPALNKNMLYKAFRQKDIKVNGSRIKENIDIKMGDVVEVFISDELLFGVSEKIKVIYEDDNILVVNKRKYDFCNRGKR